MRATRHQREAQGHLIGVWRNPPGLRPACPGVASRPDLVSGWKEVKGAAGCIPKLGVVAFSPLCSSEPPEWADPAPQVDHLAVVSLGQGSSLAVAPRAATGKPGGGGRGGPRPHHLSPGRFASLRS